MSIWMLDRYEAGACWEPTEVKRDRIQVSTSACAQLYSGRAFAPSAEASLSHGSSYNGGDRARGGVGL